MTSMFPARKIAVMATSGAFTTVRGVDIPIWSCIGIHNNVPEAADFIAKLFPSPENVEFYRFILMEIPDAGY